MLKNKESFWKHERDAALFNKNRGFIKPEDENTEAIVRASKLPSLLDFSNAPKPTKPFVDFTVQGEPDRVVVKDAERTFAGQQNREHLIRVLSFLQSQFGDYAQGASYVTSYLMLFLEVETVVDIILLLNKDDKYLPGYWKSEAVAFATDAYVFDHLLAKYFPKVQVHLYSHGVLPETYAQKWFVGLGIHVLPFEALGEFFEHFLTKGHTFLLQFGLSLINEIQDSLLAAKDAASLYALLRLDTKASEEKALDIVRNASKFDLSEFDFKKLRPEIYDLKLRKRMESAQRAKEENHDDDIDSDDEEEGEECGICQEMIPDFYCENCKVLICEECHDESKGTHKKKEHKLKSIDEVDVDALTKEIGSMKIKGDKKKDEDDEDGDD